jgi:hypothetical protein
MADTGVDWDSPTWGSNPVHEASDGSWVTDRHERD